MAYKDGMRLADMLRVRIDELGLTAKAAAAEMGVDPVNVSRWLDQTVPKPDQHPALMSFLEVDDRVLARLLHDQKVRPPTIEDLAAQVAVLRSEVEVMADLLRELVERSDR